MGILHNRGFYKYTDIPHIPITQLQLAIACMNQYKLRRC